jgi:hypothetical protein
MNRTTTRHNPITPPPHTQQRTTTNAGLAGALGLVAGASSASAGWLNSDSLPEVIKPKDAEIDLDLVKSSGVSHIDWGAASCVRAVGGLDWTG